MNQIVLILALFATLCVLSCKNETIENIDITTMTNIQISRLKTSGVDSMKFEFCSIISLDWDSLIVIGPYHEKKDFKKLPFKNKSVINNFYINNDWTCSLAYFKNNKIVGYSVVEHYPLALIYLSEVYYYGFRVFARADCDKLFISVSKQDPSFIRLTKVN